jgi:16S rRNA (guanine(966)-N(2))-methyltransferase RsmD
MRIIAGSKAGMRLLSPRDMTTRPITDRVKESLMAILEPKIKDSKVADLFCGTGSLGLESLSRGAVCAVMVDNDRDALERLRRNIAKLGFGDRTYLLKADVFRCGVPDVSRQGKTVDGLWGGDDQTACAGVVFVDPPFADTRNTSANSKLGKLLAQLSGQVADGVIVVVRHEKQTRLLEKYVNLEQYDRRDYGSMAITFLEKNEER